MTARVYYNEIEPYAAEWLRNLIAGGHIAPGDVDTRDIRDVRPDDLRGYTQCHFFAGIGVWSYALRRAGWPDDRPVWTGSCPCQPFSAAGRGDGFADERHLWPHWFHLIRVCRPGVVFGEQVASKDGLNWVDLVHDDMEGAGYAFWAQDRCSAGVGAPHIRQRLYLAGTRSLAHHHHHGRTFVEAARLHDRGERRHDPDGRGGDGELGHHHHQGLPSRECEALLGAWGRQEGRTAFEPGRASRWLADDRLFERSDACGGARDEGQPGRWIEDPGATSGRRSACELAHSSSSRGGGHAGAVPCAQGEGEGERGQSWGLADEPFADGADCRPGPVNGFWRNADWLLCKDGKWRPVEPGLEPLAHGVACRVGKLRAFGNAIDAENARDFIETFLESEAADHRELVTIDAICRDLIG